MPSLYVLMELVKLIFVFWFSPFSTIYRRKSSSIFFHKAGSSLLFSVTLVDVCILLFTSFTLLFSDSVSKAMSKGCSVILSRFIASTA